MFKISAVAAAAVLVLGAMPGAALAAESTLQLIVGGEAYDGPPKFEVSFDGKVVGDGTVDAAIDTATAGRFADAGRKADYVQTFNFAIPEDVFRPSGEVRIRFLNEAYGGDGSNRDRNLYIASVAVNGRAVTLSGLTTQGTKARVDNETLGEFLVIRDGNEEGVSRPPDGGWPVPGSAVVDAAPADTPPAAASPAAQLASADAPAAPADAPAAPAKVVEDVAAVETADAPSVEAGDTPDCRDTLYNVVGFNENSNDLTPRLRDRLDQIVADIGERKCRVLITGYSSRQGAFDTNALFAIERAQNVLSYLRQSGLNFQQVAATGGGATDRFGENLAANRRVVITLGP